MRNFKDRTKSSKTLLFFTFLTFSLICNNAESAATSDKSSLKVWFTDVANVTSDTPVLFSGNPAGHIRSITILEENIDNKIAHNGKIYPYELSLEIHSPIRVYTNDNIAIIDTKDSNGNWARAINITPMPQSSDDTYSLATDTILYGTSLEPIENSLRQLANTSKLFEKNLEKVQKTALVEKMASTIEQFDAIGTALNNPEAWSSFLQHLSLLLERVVDSWMYADAFLTNLKEISDKVKSGEGSAGKALMTDALYNKTIQTLANSQQLTEELLSKNSGFNKLLVNDTSYLAANALMSKIDIILNDINHYGVLFHLNKSWQRHRARQKNLRYTLSTPQEFRNYFNDELDGVFTSIHRVSDLLESAGRCDLFCCSGEFKKVLIELQRRVNFLQEEVRSYNIQLFEECHVPLTELRTY